MSDIEKRLRDSLAAHAGLVPDRHELAERIVGQADGSVVPIERARRWKAWAMPLVAAGAVAGVAGALVGIGNATHHIASPAPATQQHTATQPAPSPSVPAPKALAPTDPSGLARFQIVDTTFVGTKDGWALGTADCLNGSGPGCSAMVRTTDGGASWRSMPPPAANVPDGEASCADPCISGLRFATEKVGYAFGPSALFMTTDGGRSWNRQAGGADRLETLDGNVIRLSVQGCSASCPTVQTAPIGSPAWKPAPLSGIPYGAGGFTVALARTGGHAYIWADSLAKNALAPVATAFYTSSDDGHSWTHRADPCSFVPNTLPGGDSVSVSLAPAADGSITVACISNEGGMSRPISVATSTDGGRTFTAATRQAMPANMGAGIPGAASSRVLFLGGWTLYRTTDGGRTWKLVARDVESSSASPGVVALQNAPGFENATTGHWVSFDRRTIWTTHDGGVTWTPYTFR